MDSNPERARVEAEARRSEHWTHWGPYVSDRQWGTVREDYSAGGDAWTYFPFEHARSRAYRWGEDGIFGISDDRQRLCFAPAFWNGNDPILKERFFGLSGPQGNHGEDVKECYYYLDNVPSHAYMRALYKYPQRTFPYADLVGTSAKRSRAEPEYELIDTGIFDDDEYFDIEVEYAKNGPSDVSIRIAATNRSAAAAPLHVVPQLWFRNEWSWSAGQPHGRISLLPDRADAFVAAHPLLGDYVLRADAGGRALFVENESNLEVLFGAKNPQPYVKDGIDRAIVRGEAAAVSTEFGSKLGLDYARSVPPGATWTLRLRLAPRDVPPGIDAAFDATFDERRAEADRFYMALSPYPLPDEERRVQRAAWAGMLWSKQYYLFVVRDWLRGDPLMPVPPSPRLSGRNHSWLHVYNDDVLSMPDTWEYPWYAAWDLAFQALVLAPLDPGFAKRQLLTLTREWYMHPNGQLPAYEWNFDDVNPPVHAWAAYRIFKLEYTLYGTADYVFLERVFQKLLMNFTWWVNREDPAGDNVFMGGFLGLDNIGVFNRSATLPAGARILQADATGWMAVYALDMMRIALELAQHNASYEDIASKFFEHFVYISHALNDSASGLGLWDEDDGFYYDRLDFPDGRRVAMRVRSMVGLLPLLAVATVEPQVLERLPNFVRRVEWFIANRPELSCQVARTDGEHSAGRRMLAVLDAARLKRVLALMLADAEFLSPYGIRSLSKWHEKHPLLVRLGDSEFRVAYDPAESSSGLFGGNSNWRGPVWLPLNFLLIEALQQFHSFYGDAFRLEYPTGSGNLATLQEIATDLSRRLVALFVPSHTGSRPFNGSAAKLGDPHFRDLLLFYEYFHGDNGAGLGASHQTGWTGLVALLIAQTSHLAATGDSPLEWHHDAMPQSVTP